MKIEEQLNREFQNMFTFSKPCIGNELKDQVEPCINDKDIFEQMKIPNESEIKEAISSMNSAKASGFDGFL